MRRKKTDGQSMKGGGEEKVRERRTRKEEIGEEDERERQRRSEDKNLAT